MTTISPSTAWSGLGQSARDAMTLTRRIMLHWTQRPAAIALGLLFPVLIVVMFGYLFGGAMAIPGGNYVDFLIPGMLAMTMLFGLEAVALAVTTDNVKGITQRLRTLPVNAAAVLTGRSFADLLNGVLSIAVMVATGLLMGWRPDRGPLYSLGAVGLLLWLRFAFTWVGIYLGVVLRTPESAVTVQILVWPVGFLSSVYVSPMTMPGWLGAIAAWNPLSATATAVRDLFGNPAWSTSTWPARHAVLLAVLWPALLTIVFLPLAAWLYRLQDR